MRSERKTAFCVCKRCFDVAAAALAGTALFVPMLAIAAAVRLDSPGPALFRQERLGRDGAPFVMLKFRSMRLDAEADGPRLAVDNDPRCTRVGRVLRRTKLDELPQLWNILKGEMSFVGPRPERACFYGALAPAIPGFRARLQVTPGLTGLAQISGGYDLPPEQKLRYDLQYIDERSAALDLRCLCETAVQIAWGRPRGQKWAL